jgi:hypothetical protein
MALGIGIGEKTIKTSNGGMEEWSWEHSHKFPSIFVERDEQ